ncbi:MAG TPA: alpha/beta hydrolase [Bacteroidia bacterium]|jgi:pimeloyl-ACP methyl ester carboxylesterase|nr:alpha/beta hydrolase [Bacteroidia bacterium]
MKKSYILFALLVVSFSSCFKLDSQLFNNLKCTQYLLDNYTGTQDFILDNSYKIPDSLIHIFTLQSREPSESSATQIYAIYIGDINKIATDTVIMYCHGNKWNMDFYWQRAKLLANTGSKNQYGVLMVDYRGYGMSSGMPTEDGMYADVDAALQWLSNKGLSNSRLMIYGFSLGSAPATMLTANPRSMTPSKLILEAPFASSATLVNDATQLDLPPSYVTTFKIDNADEIKSVNQPFMWMHGLSDTFLNWQTNGLVVYNNYQGTYKEKHLIPGADHGEIPVKDGFVQYSSDLYAFIKR